MGWQSYLFRTVGSFIILSERNEYVPLMSLCFSVIILHNLSAEGAKQHTVLDNLSTYVF